MIVKRFFAYQLARSLPERFRGAVELSQEKAALLVTAQAVLIAHRSYVLAPQASLETVVATADQTPATRQRIAALAAALTKGDPAFASLSAAEPAAAVAEVSLLEAGGRTAKFEGTWYVFGSAAELAAQDIPLGVTAQALEQQLQAQGMETYYLAQRQPKRVLGVFGLLAPVLPGVADAAQRLSRLGYRVQLAPSDVQPDIDSWLCTQLPLTLAAKSPRPFLAVGEPVSAEASLALAPRPPSFRAPLPYLPARGLEDVADLCEAAHTALAATRRVFFWFKP